MEELRKLEEEYGFKLLLIDSKGMLSSTREIMGEKKVRIPLLIDSNAWSRSELDVMYTPTALVLDGEGRLRARLVGTSEDFNSLITGILEKI